MRICGNKRYEREFVNNMIKQGYHCERIAGSGSGLNSVCDCILFKDMFVYLVEVKATKEAKFYMRKNTQEQLDKMVAMAKTHNIKAMLAIKFKYKTWDLRVLT